MNKSHIVGWSLAGALIITVGCGCFGKVVEPEKTDPGATDAVNAGDPSVATPPSEEASPADPPTSAPSGSTTLANLYPCSAGPRATTHVVVGSCDRKGMTVGCTEYGYAGKYPADAQARWREMGRSRCENDGNEWSDSACPSVKRTGGGCRTFLGLPATCQPTTTSFYPFDGFDCPGERLPAEP